jgi:hypothetical protein
MDLISKKYIKLNNKLHETNLLYGTSTIRYKKTILKIINDYKITEMIDYGCGKQLAKTFLPKNVTYFPYDPAFVELNTLPEPKDFLICTDVLEHIEPEYLDNVLLNICNLTNKICFLTIALRKASKTLPDGRNAHLIVKDKDFWLNKINIIFNKFNKFNIINTEYKKNDYINLILVKKL